jgi:hypothetical protein
MKSTNKSNKSKKIIDIVSTNKFFYFIIGFFVVQAAWIALSSNYPMAFDEDFHLGLINLYSQHLTPFWSSHPITVRDAFGALTRDPHIFITMFLEYCIGQCSTYIHNFALQILILRFINIFLLSLGLVLFRRLLLKLKTSPINS